MTKVALLPKILSEEYCCIYGYISLCQARGQTVKSMALYLGVSKDSIWRKQREIKTGTRACQKTEDCLKPVIQTLQKEKGP
jgi:hypothetical protein